MKYDFSYIYSKKSAATILNTPVSNIRKVEIWGNCIWVRLHKGSPKFVSKKAFTALFARNRQQAGQAIAYNGQVSHYHAALYQVSSQSLDGHYNVQLDVDHLECDCKDYSIQRNDLGLKKATCKHGYAVLSVLGYGTLSDYIKDGGFYKACPLRLVG